MECFDLRRGLSGNDDTCVRNLFHRSTVESGYPDRFATAVRGELHGLQKILRPGTGFVAAASAVDAECENDVARFEEILQLLGVDVFPAVIVGDRAE